MKVVIDLRPLMHGETSGVEVYLKNLLLGLRELEEKGKSSKKVKSPLEFYYFYNSFHPVEFPEELDFIKERVIWTRVPNKLLNLMLRFFKWPKLDCWVEKKAGFKPDVFFFPDPRPAPLTKEIKKITTFHDLSFERMPQNFSWRTRIWHFLLNPRREAQTSDGIIAVSSFTKRELMNVYQIPKDKIEVIPHGVDLSLGEPETEAKLKQVKAKYQLPDKFFLFVSSLSPRKNLANLVKAFRFFREKNPAENYMLVVAGKKNLRIFRHLALNLPVELVRPIGFFAEEDKRALYQLSAGLIYISFYEGFGLPVLEAFAAGIPVVAAKIGALEELMPPEGVFADPCDPGEIAGAMQRFLSEKFVQEILDYQKEKLKEYSWEKCAQETYFFFSE